jgi:predicted AlkP superfamily phosphohydrolase/phosphomutase
LLALDGSTFDVLRPLLEADDLPTLKRLYQGGAHAPLTSVFPPITASAWTSFLTGKNPAQHGIFEFLQRRPDSYGVQAMNATKRQAASLWALLSAADKQVISINIPLTYPPEPVNGALVAGMPVPFGRRDFTFPPELAQEILSRLPDYSINATSVYLRGKAEVFLEEVQREVEQRLNLAELLLSRYDWDAAMVHILGTDRIQHEFWHCMDASHPEHRGEALRYQNAIRDYYRYIDARLERVLRFADEQTTVIVLSDHGFGPLTHFVYLNTWLLREGYLVLKRDALTRFKRLAFGLGFSPTRIYRLVQALGLGGLRGEIELSRRQALLDTLFLSFQDVDWGRTRAYARGNFGQIFLNVVGREPQGCVARGAEYEALREELSARLLATLRDPITGAALVVRVEKREALFSGPLFDEAPDLAVFMADERYVPLGTADFPAATVAEKAVGNTGDHRMDGILIMNGRGVKQGATGMPRLLDLAPTVLYLLGVAVPDDMDGRVLHDFLSLDSPTQYQSAPSPTTSAASSPYSAEEEAEIMKHLEDLGYLG